MKLAENVVESKTFSYEGYPVSFSVNGAIMASATEMAKPFGKLVGDWLRLKSTEEFVNALSSDMQIPISALVQIVKGGIQTGVALVLFRREVKVTLCRVGNAQLELHLGEVVAAFAVAHFRRLGDRLGQADNLHAPGVVP